MKYIILLLVMALACNSSAQNKPATAIVDTQVYTFAEQMPEPDFDLLQFFSKNIRYPDSLAEGHGTPGRMAIQFIVYEDGHTGNYVMTRSSGIPAFDRQVLQTLSKMPLWKPGRHNGKNVKVYYSTPLSVHIE